MQTANIILLILCVVLMGSAQERSGNRCYVPDKVGGRYKLISQGSPLGAPHKVLLDVVIKPGNFKREYMIAFAERIRAEYCDKDVVLVAIFDSKKAQLGWHYDLVVSKGKAERRRGNCVFDRAKGSYGCDFSTKAGSPINEVTIELLNHKKDQK